jgi:hypothetical protein
LISVHQQRSISNIFVLQKFSAITALTHHHILAVIAVLLNLSNPENNMYLVAIAWMYVVVMMSVAEATAANGTVLGAVVTFVFYGVLPCMILMYLMGTPMRRKALRAQEKNEPEAWPEQTSPQTLTGQSTTMSPSVLQPDASSHTATDVIAPVREKP